MKTSPASLLQKNAVGILLFVIGLMVGVALMSASVSITSNVGTQVASVGSLFNYYFSVPGTLHETGSMQESTSPYWWVNSGGYLKLSDGVGATAQGDAALTDTWRLRYASSNPVDTDNGLHPQNLFRFLTRSQWDNVGQESQFYIVRDNFSSSPNRNASNGLLLMSRYMDAGKTLYYAGVRVDGKAVIKKKYKGAYYTMAMKKVFPGTYEGSRDTKNLIPHDEWISLRTETKTSASGGVTVSLYLKRANETSWTKILEASDTGQYGSTPPITGKGYGGIRTDFMDVKFDNFKAEVI
jgi:hypothetical protein